MKSLFIASSAFGLLLLGGCALVMQWNGDVPGRGVSFLARGAL